MGKSYKERKNMILNLMGNDLYVPMKEKELAVFLQVMPEDRPVLSSILKELLEEKKIEISKRGKYTLYDPKLHEEEDMITGTFISNHKGFGFVEVEGRDDDLYISKENVNGAFHLDIVEARIISAPSDKRRVEAKIVRVVERGTDQIVGVFQKSPGFGFVIPDDHKLSDDIFIPKEYCNGAVDGHKVVVKLTSYGGDGKKPEGKVIEILGHINDPGVDILSIVKGFGLPTEFPEKVLNQAFLIGDEVSEADMAGREDLRSWQMVTIDGEDTKDIDDAVSLTREGEDYILGVHIADVSNYVQYRSALDREALSRGTSVYLVDTVIPMLPHKLSNGICSLNEKVDRLTLSCIMRINTQGKVIDYRIVESVINVDRRMDYTTVNRIISDKDESLRKEYGDLVCMFDDMAELSRILRAMRKKRGAIDFDLKETTIKLDDNGMPVEIRPYDRNDATMLIESFMLIANETVASHYYWLESPFIYRTHDNPDPEKIKKLAAFISNFDLKLKVGKDDIHPKEIQRLLSSIQDTDEEVLITRLALRSMKQAKYTVDNSGHFGLAAKYYCHFTSPIRRYPDLQIHRIIKDHIRGRMKKEKLEEYDKILFDVAAQSSRLERRAEEAEREVEKLKKCQYMSKRIGNEYEGVISGVTEWGLYVELPNTVEGLVHISKLDGYYIYDEENYELKPDRGGKTYALGQTVNVIVDSVDEALRTIDFVIKD
ncbi:MAG: ribonuclease R [Lachnospiraceae bacterium]|nr:ribonuclease R [Lachnospiraceae bacterium]